MIFTKKELTITFSMKEQAEIRQLLEDNQIKYTYKIKNRNSASPFSSTRGRTGTLGQNKEIANEYVFYVDKKDYEKAKDILAKTVH